MSSILNDIKHMLGITAEETAFDTDLIMYINSAFSKLTQLGVGPVVGYQITSALNQWAEFYTDPRLSSVSTFVFLHVKMLHDPPATGFLTDSMERQIRELEYRLNVVADYG